MLTATVTLGASRTQASEPSEKQGLQTFSCLTKINDDLFTGKIDDTLSLAMERIDENNIDPWQNYAHTQALTIKFLDKTNFEAWKKYAETTTETLKPAPPKKCEGALIFLDTLSKYQKNQITKSCNELWVAYASRKPVTQKAQFNTEKNTPPSLEMFMCVITSPQALITTHIRNIKNL